MDMLTGYIRVNVSYAKPSIALLGPGLPTAMETLLHRDRVTGLPTAMETLLHRERVTGLPTAMETLLHRDRVTGLPTNSSWVASR